MKQKKHELILFYLEPGSQTGLPLEDLLPDGKSFFKWPEIEKRITQKALKVFRIGSGKQ